MGQQHQAAILPLLADVVISLSEFMDGLKGVIMHRVTV
jgi:hypothetical protein